MQKHVWGQIEEAIAKEIENKLVKASGQMLLNTALHKLLSKKPGDEYYKSLVFMALMGASDTGLPCGIRTEGYHEYPVEAYAAIRLPEGTITFELEDANHLGAIADETERDAAILEFLASQKASEKGESVARFDDSVKPGIVTATDITTDTVPDVYDGIPEA